MYITHTKWDTESFLSAETESKNLEKHLNARIVENFIKLNLLVLRIVISSVA